MFIGAKKSGVFPRSSTFVKCNDTAEVTEFFFLILHLKSYKLHKEVVDMSVSEVKKICLNVLSHSILSYFVCAKSCLQLKLKEN